MRYHFESLNDESFQALCQAVLVGSFPNAQCLPVGMPDGGRDAFVRSKSKKAKQEITVFQVKFAKDPKSRDARESILQLVKSEKEKIDALKARGATTYYFLTNVCGTSHADVGSVDKVEKELSELTGITARCWWREDLEARINQNSSIKWSFPEILKATDLLQALANPAGEHQSTRRLDVLKKYMAYQAKYDSQLKFKQVDLQKDILDLFVDVPASLQVPPNQEPKRFMAAWSELLQTDTLVLGSESLTAQNAPHRGAVELMINPQFAARASKVVLEGAPGQGKSTLTQYLCQVNRLLLLQRTVELARVSEKHLPRSARIPFRIDLRDYASWIGGKNPFSDDTSTRLPGGTPSVLESFIAAQVHNHTGATFSVDDLDSVARHSRLLIVLDGFDEVADIATRNRVVAEVSDAVERLSQLALSLQLIVTSRPAAFANSPGFPRDEWLHVQILPLSSSEINEYADKWLQARAAEPREKRETLALLSEKLDQPHVKDLARNPMQLAILLSLILARGTSLPDKRTAMYDSYIDIFLNRESEKSAVVRENRDTLVRIHRFLAWTLQAEAEISGSGSITESRLRELLHQYLRSCGQKTELVDQLFSGMMERVVVLVSRIQGTFEFEVQPLREYFAARYLYDTAPYIPPGSLQRGSIPERFDALSRNFYWLNVARFYAGCYSTGELASIIDGIEAISTSEQFKDIAHTSNLSLMLLSDYVFGHYPFLAERLAEKFLCGSQLQLLIASGYAGVNADQLVIPAECGQSVLIDQCKKALINAPSHESSYPICRALRANCSAQELKDFWKDAKSKFDSIGKWLVIGSYLGAIDSSDELLTSIIESEPKLLAVHLANFGSYGALEEHPQLWGFVLDNALDTGSMYFPVRVTGSDVSHRGLLITSLSLAISQFFLIEIWDMQPSTTAGEAVMRFVPTEDRPANLKLNIAELDPGDQAMASALNALLGESVGRLRDNISFIDAVLARSEEKYGERWATYVAASTYVDMTLRHGELDTDVSSSALVKAVSFISRKGDTGWWLAQLSRPAQSRLQTMIAVHGLQRWLTPESIIENSEPITEALDSLSDEEWQSVVRAIQFGDTARPGVNSFSYRENRMPSQLGERISLVLSLSANAAGQIRIFDRYLKDYEGNDPSILASRMQTSLKITQSRPDAWETALKCIRESCIEGVGYYSPHLDGEVTVPLWAAKEICSSPGDYPISLVRDAEALLASEAGKSAIALSKVAVREEWF